MTFTAITIITAAVSAAAAIAEGRAQAQRSAFQASIANQQAERANQRAKLDEARFRRKLSADLASARARFGARGIDPSTGSSLLSLEDGAGVGELDALTVRSQGLDRATQYRNQATLSLMDASAAEQKAAFSATSSLLNARKTIVSRRR